MDISALKNEIIKGKNAFKAFEQAEAVLTEIETLEHVKKDMETRVSAAKSSLQSLKDEADKVSGIISAAKDKAGTLVSDAETAVDGIILKANVKAGEIIAAADKKAQDIAAESEATDSKILHLQNALSGLWATKEKVLAEIDALEAIKDKARKALGV